MKSLKLNLSDLINKTKITGKCKFDLNKITILK